MLDGCAIYVFYTNGYYLCLIKVIQSNGNIPLKPDHLMALAHIGQDSAFV
jgi:hypothetical protein